MSGFSEQHVRVLVSTDDPVFADTAQKACSGLEHVRADTIASGSDIVASPLSAYDVVIIDIGNGDLLYNEEFLAKSKEWRDVRCLFVSDQLDQERVRQIIKFDVDDWLTKPISARKLADGVSAVSTKGRKTPGSVHAVLPCGGGAGGTSVSVTLAHYLSRKKKRETHTCSLLDLDFTKADVGAFLNVENEYRIETALNHPEKVDLEFVNVIRKKFREELSIFSFESRKLPFHRASSELVLRLLDLMSIQDRHTVVDLTATYFPWQDAILGNADSVTIVTTPNVPAVQKAKQLYRETAKLRGSQNNIRIIVNKNKSSLFGSSFGKKKVASVFDGTKLFFCPDERDVFDEAINRAIMPVDVNSRSKFCSVISKLADQLTEPA